MTLSTSVYPNRSVRRNFLWNFYGGDQRTPARLRAPAAAFRARPGGALSLYAGVADRSALPASAVLFRICRRGDRPFRSVGGRLDGTRAHPALPAVGDARARFRAGRCVGRRPLVGAVALRTLARNE